MKRTFVKKLLFGSTIILSTMVSCKKDNGPGGEQDSASGPDVWERKYVTLTASFPDETGTAGNGGTMAYSLTMEEAVNPSKTINIYSEGFALRSERTARVQASKNGNFLYNIQYTGTNGGVFNKYRVKGGGSFEETGEEVNTAPLLGTSPRWVKAAEGLGVGVSISGASAPIDAVKAEAGTQTYEYVRGTVKIAHINLDDPSVPNSAEFPFPFSDEEKAAGYSVTRIDVPVLNAAKNKLYIGCWVSKVDPVKPPVKTVNANTGAITWNWVSDAANIAGTVTMVLDYPSLTNPKLIWSARSKYNNNSYRTMSQYIGDDGHVYQSTGQNTTSYPHILRIDKNTNNYDNTYLFDLGQALGVTGVAGIKAWTYISGGKAFVLYDINGKGGYLALIDLNAKTATKIANDYEATLSFSQYQNVVVAGDYVYVPLTPLGQAGRLYVVNWRTGTVMKGAVLTGQAGSSYIGAY